MARSGAGFDLADFLSAISATVRPGTARPVVVHAAELETLPAGQVHNPTTLAVAGRLPTVTFELFRQTIPVRSLGLSFDMPVWTSLDLAAFVLAAAAATAIFRFNIGMLWVLAGSCAAGVGLWFAGWA